MADLEKVVQGKGGNLKVIEDGELLIDEGVIGLADFGTVLRQKVMSGEAVAAPAGGAG